MKFVTLFAALFLAASAQAGLQWDKTEIDLAPELGAAAAEAVFTFKNTGPSPVRLAQVTSSCGCTVPKLEKDLYAPGETGEIRAKFTVGSRQGRQESAVTVLSDDPAAQRTVLKLHIDIPTAVDIRPRVIYWTVNEEPTAKAMEVKVHPSLKVAFKEVRALTEGFFAEIKPGSDANTWLVEIRPQDTQNRRRATFELITEAPVPGAGPLTVFAFVR
jgi:hypothetical protein